MLTLKLAFRNIVRNRRRTLLTGLSMFAGYVLLVLSFSIQDGSYHKVLKAYTQGSSGHIQITQNQYLDKPTLYRTVNDYQQVIKSLEGISVIKAVTPRIHSAALAYGENKTAMARLVGIDPVREQSLSFLQNKISQGQYFTSSLNQDGYAQAMIGQSLASQLKLKIGDELVLITQGADGSMANDIFIISAIIGGADSNERLNVYLPLTAIQSFLSLQNRVHRLVLLVDDYQYAKKRSEQIKIQLEEVLKKESLAVHPWQVVEKEFYRVMKADKDGNKITMYIVVFLVCLGVLNTILMNILERTGEFGVLKAIGTLPSRIFVGLLLETGMLAIICCLMGFVVAFPINYYLTEVGILLPEPMSISGIQMDHMQGLMTLGTFLQPAMIIFLATLLIALYPAFRASRLMPLDAMRKL